METGGENFVQINLMSELVDLYKVTVVHHGKTDEETEDEWHLDRMELVMMDTTTKVPLHHSPTVFHFGKWLRVGEIYEAGYNYIQNMAYTVKGTVRNTFLRLFELTN